MNERLSAISLLKANIRLLTMGITAPKCTLLVLKKHTIKAKKYVKAERASDAGTANDLPMLLQWGLIPRLRATGEPEVCGCI